MTACLALALAIAWLLSAIVTVCLAFRFSSPESMENVNLGDLIMGSVIAGPFGVAMIIGVALRDRPSDGANP